MRPADKHLTPQELDLLLLNPADSRDSNATGALPPEAQQHLNGCMYCQSVADKCRKAEEALRNLRTWSRTSGGGKALAPGSECPPEDTWPTLAAGMMRDEKAAPFITHAATCSWCGPRLKEAMHDLADDITAEEQEALAKLPSASPGWQRAMARELAAQQRKPKDPQPDPKPVFSWWPKLAWATALPAVAIIAVAIGWLVWLKTREPDVNALLAQASIDREQRVIELRMQGAPYGQPPSAERGTGKRDLPASFDTALGIIKTKLSEHPQDPYWLQVRARASLLEGDYEAANSYLHDALELKPKDPGLLLDEATAFYEKAKHNPSESYFYGKAAEDLGDILDQDPRNRVALFNKAIIDTELKSFDRASNELNQFLLEEPSGPWADEARSRLDELKKRKQQHDQSQAEPLLSPDEFMRRTRVPKTLRQIDSRIEDYQDEAIANWLPAAFPTAGHGNRTALAAIRALADILIARHKDKWLHDFIVPSSNPPVFGVAIMALHNAVARSGKGQWEADLTEAQKAKELFFKAGSIPGQLRAAVEEVHALRGAQQGEACLQRAGFLEAKLRNAGYRWINTQLQIDQCSCAIMAGIFDRADRYIKSAEKAAVKINYPTLHLRAIGIAASADTVTGRMTAAWAKNESGLKEYWKGTSPPLRAQQFYDDLTVSAEELGEWNLAVAFGQESAHAMSLTADRETERMVRRHLAKLAIQAGNFDLAKEELRRSDELSADESMAGNAYSEIDLAQIELQQGNLREAEERLNAIKVNLNKFLSFEIQLGFYSTYAGLLERKGQTKEAAEAFQKAIEIVDSNANNLSNSTDRYLWNLEVSGLYRSLIDLEMEQGNASYALQIWEWYRAGQLRRLSPLLEAFNPFLGKKEINRIMPGESASAIVSYAVLPHGLAIWVVNNKRVDAVFQPGETGSLVRLSSHFTELCSNPNSNLSLLRQEGRQLYEQLITPIAKQIAEARVLSIETDDVLGDLPFDAMLSSDNRYLAELHSLTYSPGLLYGGHLRNAGTLSSRSRMVSLGSTAILNKAEWSMDPIPEVEAEAQSVADKFLRSVSLKGKEAAVDRLERLLPQAEIVHLAAHGLIMDGTEGLLLFAGRKNVGASAQDTVLWGAEHARPELFSRANLVVLSACSSGKSTKSRLEVHGGLVRALLGIGVPNVVASRWNVDSTLTVGFMDEFYSHLIHGSSVSSALASAEEQVRTKLHKEHPYYWAAFAVIGRG